MNSRILSILSSFFTVFADVFKKSRLNRIVGAVYDFFSRMWKKSAIISALKKKYFENLSDMSGFCKLVHIPVSILDLINKKIGTKLSEMLKKSIFVDWSKCFMNNALALNTRFYGCIILAVVAAREMISLRFSALTAVFAVIGIVLAVTDLCITDTFAGSKAVRFCLGAVGFGNVSFDIYDKEQTGRPLSGIIAVIVGIIIGVVSVKSPLLAHAVPVCFTGFAVIMSYPVSGVFFAAFAAPFVPTILLAGLCLLTFFAFFVKAITTKDFNRKTEGVGIGLAFFLILMLISSFFSFNTTKSLMVWAMYLIFAGFYFVIVNTVETKDQLYGILKVFVIAGALVSVYGVCQYIFGWNTTNAWIDEEMFEEATMRAYSTMGNPNVLGEYLLLMIPLSAAFMIKAKKFSFEQLFYAATFLVGCLCMVFTQSRGCWLGLMLAAAIFVTFYNGKLWAFAPFLLLIIPFVIPQTMADRMMSVGNLEDSSTSYRVFIWLGTLEMMKDFWLGGIGMGEGAFRSVYPLYSYNGIIAPHSHNTFLQLLVEGGVCALAGFIVMMFIFFKKLHSVYEKSAKNGMHALLTLAIGSGCMGFLLQSMFDYTFYNYRMMAMFFIIVALGVTLGYVKELTI